MSNKKKDPYVGKIVRRLIRLSFLTIDCVNREWESGDLLYYPTSSLFLVVGIKNISYGDADNDYYILKPLNNDHYNQNIDKQLVWDHGRFYVNSGFNEQDYQIVED